eukprot:TRINITY_DN15759_c0_g1_i1.p1 TRINITY_DN15759_c0_g1~~TRINITY_DN15759_c0_g1_i1.p1  ORF type:complete len:437 (+),score=141.36 TRINITY_DN15759_c0_g1_i1:70-1380(+)
MAAMNRLRVVASAVPGAEVPARTCAKLSQSDDDVVIVAGCRTAIGKAFKGNFKDTPPIDMLAAAVREAVKRAGIDPKLVEDVVVGNVLQDGAGGLTARMATLLADLPYTHSCMAVNRQCSSGLQACANVAAAIKSGSIEVGVASGVDSMSGCQSKKTPFPDDAPNVSQHLTKQALDTAMQGGHPGRDDHMADALVPMGITSENVAVQFKVGRQEQDEFAFRSWENANRAVKEGLFKAEIVPVTTKVRGKDGEWKEVVVSADEGVRATTMERLSKLKPVFSKTGTTTAGNCSQMSDGAAALVMMKRSKARELGCPIMGTFRSFAVAGVPPKIMGIGPVYAIPKALRTAGLSIGDVDVWELNEAFASQAVYSAKALGIPSERVNPLGGAIALGHPLGMTGCRQIVTLLNHLERTGQKTGVVSMCVGTGMGAAAVVSRE